MTQLLLTLAYDNLLCFVIFLYSQPLYSAYLLYFSPCILQLISFFFPLLLSTSIFLLLFCHHSLTEGEATTISLLDQLVTMVVAAFGNVFEWEFEVMGELYKNVALIYEVEVENSPKIYVQDSAESEVLQSNIEPEVPIAEIDNCLGPNSEVRGNPLETPLNCYEKAELLQSHVGISSAKCDMREDSVKHSSEKFERSENLESNSGIGDEVFVPQTPDRASEMLENYPLVRRAKKRGESVHSLSRSGSMWTRSMSSSGEFYECSSLNFEVAEGLKSSEKMQKNLSKSVSLRSKDLPREGSMRKEKEWRRTLACKLYEERMAFKLHEKRAIAEGVENMDLLWETYESDVDKANKLKNKGKKGKKESNIEEENDEEEEESVTRLCCLQPFRFSSSKMNLGAGRHNLEKISNAFKSFGSFRRSTSSRNKKG